MVASLYQCAGLVADIDTFVGVLVEHQTIDKQCWQVTGDVCPCYALVCGFENLHTGSGKYNIFIDGVRLISVTVSPPGLVMAFQTTALAAALALSDRYSADPEPDPLEIYTIFRFAGDCCPTTLMVVPAANALMTSQVTEPDGMASTFVLRHTFSRPKKSITGLVLWSMYGAINAA